MSAKRVVEGLTVITVGAILLGNTLGYLSWSVWWTILSLWPLLIISIGLEILGKGLDNEALRVFSSLIVIGGLLASALILPTSGPRWFPTVWFDGESEPFSFTEPHEAAVRRGTADIESGAGELAIAAGRDLATAEGESPFDDPELSAEVSGREARVDFTTGSGSGSGRTVLDFTLDESVVWDLSIECGAVSLDADLSDLEIESLDVRTGASDLDITFGDRAARSQAMLRAGVCSIVLRVPEDLGVEVQTSSALVTVRVPGEFHKVRSGERSVWRAPGFDNARRTLAIEIEAGISNVEIVTY